MRVIHLLFILILAFNTPVGAAAEEVYICPMHTHIEGEAGDTCPICGMDLVLKSKAGQESQAGERHKRHDNALKISPAYIQALGVQTTSVKRREFGREIRAFGEIVPSTRRAFKLDMRSAGWIVDLKADAVGDDVEKGDLLFTYYSSELMSAQADYLLERGSVPAGMDPALRLRLFGMGAKSITRLEEEGQILAETPFYAPESGTIDTLNVREGAYVKEGETVLMLQDYGRVWVEADVPVRDLQFLEEGGQAQVIVPETGRRYDTQISLIHDRADPETRTGRVRLVVEQNTHELRPGTYVDVIFSADAEERLAVPMESVLYGGDGAIVIESLGDGHFRPVAIETGITANGFTEIKDGLEPGQNIVKTGQFMIDAESNLRGGMSQMSGMNDQNDTMKDMNHGKDMNEGGHGN